MCWCVASLCTGLHRLGVKGNLPNTHHNLSHSSFLQQRHLHPTSRAAAVPTPASAMAISPPLLRARPPWHHGAKSGTAQGDFLSLWLPVGGNCHIPAWAFFKSLSREGGKKTKKGQPEQACMCVGEVWETELSPAAAPSAGELDVPLGWPGQQPVPVL